MWENISSFRPRMTLQLGTFTRCRRVIVAATTWLTVTKRFLRMPPPVYRALPTRAAALIVVKETRLALLPRTPIPRTRANNQKRRGALCDDQRGVRAPVIGRELDPTFS